ncbi:hypothetical protein PJ15_3069 [Acinetobacter sp. neg1]|uniref:hypothetical protein n=1 Tax=Acinetobacter TaxID=469 RepID=UPI0005438F6E|nr:MULTISPECIES: hypothetical protein [Acinetobacter]KHF76315.1 hypothetical protein PJ15_3069 [Acinetobacter sp. neg1]MBJ8484364.1 hypothetical protein [Acinetobacter vivianii]
MKKLLVLTLAATFSFSAFAASENADKPFSTTELKAMSCADLSVEQANAKRELAEADKNIANINANAQAPGKAVSKWAGLASGALSTFAGNSEKAAKVSQIANNLAGEEDTSDAANLTLQQAIKTKAQTNIDNMTIYQKSKKCKM